MKRHTDKRLRTGEVLMGYSFSLPVVAFLFFFIFIAIGYCFYMSFLSGSSLIWEPTRLFTGLDNYLRVFSDKIF